MNRFLKLTLAAAVFAAATLAPEAQTFRRKPFLQQGSPTRAMVCWRLSANTALTVRFGTDSTNLARRTSASVADSNACVVLDTLAPSTRYFYDVYAGEVKLTATTQYLRTHPPKDARGKYDFWIIGDPGSGTTAQQRVRNAYISVNGGTHADGLIMLGDNAYEQGTDAQFTTNLFTIYADIMANTFTWPAIGNHENMTSSGTPYKNAFYLPNAGQSGGVASGSELYYSFDYGNIHFIILDSEISSRAKAGAQYLWLEQDLAATNSDWIVAYWHHPSYTWGSHNSDTEAKHLDMRGTFQPLLEQYGVDMIFGGHSHDYERTFFLDSAYGTSTENVANRAKQFLDTSSGNPDQTGPYRKVPGPHKGTVYTVAGSSGKLDVVTGIVGKHPVMYVQHLHYGSVILTVNDSVATATFVDSGRVVRDKFQIVKSRPVTGIAGKPKAFARAMPKFIHSGRHFQFDAENAQTFRLYTPEGATVYEGAPKGRWEATRSLAPTGEYYYRFGTAFGHVSLQ